ncbi:MAG: hypothetical protein R3E53_21920 [Myxococcota bacterium]
MGEEGGLIDEAKGRAKEAAGSLLDDDDPPTRKGVWSRRSVRRSGRPS